MSIEEAKFEDFEKGLVSLYERIYGKNVRLSTSAAGDEEFQLAQLLSKSSSLYHQRAREKFLLRTINNNSFCQDQRDELNEQVNESSIFSSTPSTSTSPNHKRQLVEDESVNADSTEFQAPLTQSYKKIFYSPNKSKSPFNDENYENLDSDNSTTKLEDTRLPLSPIIYRNRNRSNNSNSSQCLSQTQSQPSQEEEEELITVDEEDQDSSLSLLTSRKIIKTNKTSKVTTTAANSSSSSSSQNSQGTTLSNRSLFLSSPGLNSNTQTTQKKKNQKQTAGKKWYFKTVLSPSESHLKQPTLKEMTRKAPPQMIDLLVIRELQKSDSGKAKEGQSSNSSSKSNELAVMTEESKGKGKSNVVLQSQSGSAASTVQLNKTPPMNTSSNSEETLIKDILNEFQINPTKKTSPSNQSVKSAKPQPQPARKETEAIKSARVSDSKLQVAIIDKRNKIAIDFDEPKPKPSNSPTYAYVPKKAIRGKKERAKLEGWDCDVCVEYYKAIESQLGEDKIKELQNKCSKHRGKYQYRNANTPPGYWRTDFPSTQSCRELGIGYYGQDQDSPDEDV